jgi:hypothetical protein
MKGPIHIRNTFVAVVFLGLVGIAARNVIDPDVWWHLKTGEYIAASKSVPHTDPFSYTRAGQPWVAHEWLADLLIYGLYRAAGWGGLIVLFSAIMTAAFFLLYLRSANDPYLSGILALGGAWGTAPVWGVRPQVLSLLLTSLWLLLLERSERDRNLLWWTLPLTLLWVNLHAGFALGLALLALFLAGESWERIFTTQPERNSAPRLRALAITLLLDLLIVPLNPNGATLYRYPFETLRSHAMQAYIAEWASPNFHSSDYLLFLFLLLAVVVCLAWSRMRPRPRDLLLLVVSTFAALSSIRMIPLFVLVAVPVLSRTLKEWAAFSESRPRAPAPVAVFIICVTILLAMTAFVGAHIAQVIHRQPAAEAEHFPAGAASYLQANRSSGPIFNHYDWGGYLIWKLDATNCVFIDGRADLYGEGLLQQFANTYQMNSDWQRALAEWQIARVIVPANSPLASGLRRVPSWSVRYEDAAVVVFSAQESAGASRPTCRQVPPIPKAASGPSGG